MLLNLLGQNFCPLQFNFQDPWLSCQDHFEFIRGLHGLPRGGLCGFPTPQNFNGKQDIRGKTQWGCFGSSAEVYSGVCGGLLTALGEEFKSNSPWCTRVHFRVWNGSSLLVQFYLKLWLISVVSVQHKLITMNNRTAHFLLMPVPHADMSSHSGACSCFCRVLLEEASTKLAHSVLLFREML